VDAGRQNVIGTFITFCLPASTFSPREPMMEKRYKCILITFSPLGLRGNDCPCRNSEGDKRSSVTENYNN